jgi:hypothetical protein
MLKVSSETAGDVGAVNADVFQLGIRQERQDFASLTGGATALHRDQKIGDEPDNARNVTGNFVGGDSRSHDLTSFARLMGGL